MKKTRYLSLFTAVLLLCGILSACNSAPQSAGLCLPGLEWGQSVDEALTALGASQEELGEDFYSETGGSSYAILRDQEVFGQKSAEIMLLFGSAYASPENTQETVSTLTQVTISYPDDADMDAVLAEMKKSFGEPAETVETYSTYDELPTEYTSDDNNQYWAGPAIREAVDGEHQKTLRETEEFAAALGMPEEYDTAIDDAIWKNYLKTPVSTARWSTNYVSPTKALVSEEEWEQLQEEMGFIEYPNTVVLDGALAVNTDADYIDIVRSLQEANASSASE